MPFEYTAKSALGKMFSGSLPANSPAEAMQSLSRDGLRPTKLEQQGETVTLFRRPVSRAEIIYLTSQLAVMTDTGLTLAAALDGVRSQEENPTLKQVLTDLKTRVEEG